MTLAIFTSGNLNALDLAIRRGEDIGLLVSNNDLSREVSKYNLEFYMYREDDELLRKLSEKNVKNIVLSGYNKLVSEKVFRQYKDRIFNIHHSLLPNHSGKGMYGLNVLKSSIDSGDEKTGFTIHKVEGDYDVGEVVFQKSFDLRTKDPEELFEEMLSFEQKHLPLFFETLRR